jgi:hypothetical protein
MSPRELADEMALICSGKRRNAGAFDELVKVYRSDAQTQAEVNARLIEIAGEADSFLAATTATLLELLEVREAQQPLLRALRRRFPEERLDYLATLQPKQIRLECLIFTKLTEALVQLDSDEGKTLARHWASAFAESWVGHICRTILETTGKGL